MPISLSQKEKIWESVLNLLKETIEDRHVFESFFAPTKLYKIDGNKFIILTDSKLSTTLLSSRYLSSIENAVKNITETNYSLSFINQDDIQSSIQTIGEEPKHNFFQSCSLNSNTLSPTLLAVIQIKKQFKLHYS